MFRTFCFCVQLYLGMSVDALCFVTRCSSGKTATKEFKRIEPACSGSLGYPGLKINVPMTRLFSQLSVVSYLYIHTPIMFFPSMCVFVYSVLCKDVWGLIARYIRSAVHMHIYEVINGQVHKGRVHPLIWTL